MLKRIYLRTQRKKADNGTRARELFGKQSVLTKGIESHGPENVHIEAYHHRIYGLLHHVFRLPGPEMRPENVLEDMAKSGQNTNG